jgi:hypothetical protein
MASQAQPMAAAVVQGWQGKPFHTAHSTNEPTQYFTSEVMLAAAGGAECRYGRGGGVHIHV